MPRHYILRPVKKLLGDWANWAKLLGDANLDFLTEMNTRDNLSAGIYKQNTILSFLPKKFSDDSSFWQHRCESQERYEE